jgi:Domain of unknown function (DUF1707)
MPAPSSPARSRWTGLGFPAYAADSGLRVSDAERAEVADELSRHYGDGRLDEAEFHQRLDQAMQAKTRADLSGLFHDLPGGPPGGPPPMAAPPQRPGRPQGRRRHGVLQLILLFVLAVAIAHAAAHAFFFFSPWLVIGLLVFAWIRFGPAIRIRRRP